MTEIQNSKLRNITGFIVILGITYAAAAVGGWASANAPGFYALLQKPSWAPPAAVFGPVWTVLYLLMAVAAWLVWRQGRKGEVRQALSFVSGSVDPECPLDLDFLYLATGGLGAGRDYHPLGDDLLTIITFYRVRPLAGFLLLPYLTWVSFAAVLNAVLWRMNPGLL